MPQRSIQVLLAVMLAFWSPIWCCCASPVAESGAANSAVAGHCSNCLPGDQLPVEPEGDGHHTCPHASLRTLAQIEKPQTQAMALSLCFVLSDVESFLLKPMAVAAVEQYLHVSWNTSPQTLVALSCQFTI